MPAPPCIADMNVCSTPVPICGIALTAKDRKLQLSSDPLIFGRRHLHQQRKSNGIKRRYDRFQLPARHRGAADGSLTGSAPDVHEDAGALSRYMMAVVVHHDSPAIKLIGTPHVLGAVPVWCDLRAIHNTVVKF